MADSIFAIRSKLNRAIAAHLINAGCGTVADVAPANTTKPNAYPNTVVQSQISRPEVPLTGIRRITVHVIIKGQAVKDPPDSEDPTDTARQAFDARVSQTYDALMQSDGRSLRATAEMISEAGRGLAGEDNDEGSLWSARALNADMADFTCQAWYDIGEGDGEPDSESCTWTEVLIFEAICSPSNVD
jgi:hypothetical protein